MKKRDYQSLYVIDKTMRLIDSGITGSTLTDEEDLKHYDFLSLRNDGRIYEVEGKALKQPYVDNDYWTIENTARRMHMRFCNVPVSSTPVTEIDAQYDSTYDLSGGTAAIPANISGKNIYYLNVCASYSKSATQNKARNLMTLDRPILAILTPDGMITFNKKNLYEAQLGYAWFYCKRATKSNYKMNKNEYGWEMKMLIDLDKGTYFPFTPPQDCFN